MPLGWLTVTVGLLLTSLAANRLAPSAHLAIGLASVAALAAVARAAGLTAAELGLTRWRSGLRWGAAPAAAVLLGYGAALLVARDQLASSTGRSWPDVLVAALVIVPLGTVLAEELAFRGVLWALLRRGPGVRAATAVSSVLFGLWHVLPALGGGAANEVATGALGGGPAGTLARVLGTVLLTTAAGAVFCWLRVRSGSLLAPALLHWTLNGLGLLAVQLAR
ncbi:MAG: CPBP family intramembrane glutamic endopeptidase [Mycobacteriales bacterium]